MSIAVSRGRRERPDLGSYISTTYPPYSVVTSCPAWTVRYQQKLRAFFSEHLRLAQVYYDNYSSELDIRLSKTELVDMRLAHLDSFIEQLAEKAQPATAIGNTR